MVSNGSESTMFLATAIDPDNEYQVCPRRRTRVAAGSSPLTGAAGHGTDALVGQTLADAMGAHLGSSLVMQAAGPNSKGTNALDINVSGFLPTLSLIESKRMATVTLPFAQNLLRMDGQVTEYAVGVEPLNQVDEVAARLGAALGSEYEVTTWKQVDVNTYERTKVLRWVLFFVALILFLLVATGIVNTMMMSVYERVREIGTMLAVGVRRWQITLMFLEEAAALGFVGTILGLAVGVAIVAFLSARGVPIKPPGGDLSIIHPSVDLKFLITVAVFAITGTVFAAVYPAWRASRLRPVEALRAT
jgi:putative ABC transport system permease protein